MIYYIAFVGEEKMIEVEIRQIVMNAVEWIKK